MTVCKNNSLDNGISLDSLGLARCVLDAAALQQLEILDVNDRGNRSTKGSLMHALDRCRTPMGKR